MTPSPAKMRALPHMNGEETQNDFVTLKNMRSEQ